MSFNSKDKKKQLSADALIVIDEIPSISMVLFNNDMYNTSISMALFNNDMYNTINIYGAV